MKSFYDALMRGVWGEHSQFNGDLNYGGPECANESTPMFKIAVNLALMPYIVYFLRTTTIAKNSDYERRF